MQLETIQFNSKFAAGNKLNVELPASDGHPGTAVDGIVIGERHHREPHALAVAGKLLGSVRAVRKIGVEVEIGVHQLTSVASRAERLRRDLMLSRMPLTNLPLSSVENFFARSTASLMLTTGGMSLR